ncbi:MAG TPA: hypothetical protein VHZ09_10015 [Acidobacteriaceae bacterium]|nr:hypothetical protein [Acidobacteriaceae bacterium]
MFDSAIVDTAIGMVFVYLLMSLIASVVQELLSTFMQLRAANLQRGLESLFSGDSLWGEDLVNMIYDHGLVRGLYRDPPAQEKRNFVEKAIHKLRMGCRAFVGVPPTQGKLSPAATILLPAYIPSRTFALAMIDFLNRRKATGDDAMRGIAQSLAEHHWIYRNNKAGEALLTLANDARGNLDTFQQKLEDWYNDSMDRVSGWYKRYTQRVLLYIGIILAIGFNVDSLRVARTLWVDRDVRQAMVQAAGTYVNGHPTGPPSAVLQNAPGAGQKAAGNGSREAIQGEVGQMNQTVEAFNQMASTSLLPIGWQGPAGWLQRNLRANFWPTVGKLFERKLPGWLLTAMAISLGAPFWFDLLNKFMVVRSTIKPQEKSQPEASKD